MELETKPGVRELVNPELNLEILVILNPELKPANLEPWRMVFSGLVELCLRVVVGAQKLHDPQSFNYLPCHLKVGFTLVLNFYMKDYLQTLSGEKQIK